MRINIKFDFSGVFILPINYNNIIQAFFYSHISDAQKRVKLHEYGYMVGPKKIKLMTFSKIFGKFKMENKNILFNSPINIIFSAYDDELVSEIAYNILTDDNLYINGVKLKVIDIKSELFNDDHYANIRHYMIEMLSPLTVFRSEDKKKIYYDPWSDEFENLIKSNIQTKLKAINANDIEKINFHIRPNNIKNNYDRKVVYFKDTFIKCFNGLFTIEAEPAIMKLIYYTGIGSKNSEGFGCVKILGA